MVIGVCGYHFSGSGAVMDLLREYEELECIDQEFTITHIPDGICDLNYNINKAASFFNGDLSVRRFWNMCQKISIPKKVREQFLALSKKYLDSIIDIKWTGASATDGTHYDGSTYRKWKMKWFLSAAKFHFFHINSTMYAREMCFSYHAEQFEKATNSYLKDVCSLFVQDGKIPVINQFFSAFNPEMSMEFVPEAKCIVVDRDPRDTLMVIRKKRNGTCLPVDNVKDYVRYFKSTMENSTKNDSDRILHIRYEDLIYYYDETVSKIESFLGVHNHINPKKYFNPSVSINNTQLKEVSPQFKEDIEYIEKIIPEYLYPFPTKRIPEGDFF